MMSENSIKSRTILISFLTIWTLIIIELMGIFIITDQINAGSPTEVSGLITQDTIWTEANSPYIIKNNTTLKAGKTLTIQPGTIIKFVNNTRLTIKGTLHVKGNIFKRVVFSAKKPFFNYSVSISKENNLYYNRSGNNYKIYIDANNGGIANISYAKFEFSSSDDGNLRFGGSGNQNLIIETIFENNMNALYMGGFNSISRHCTFENNYIGITNAMGTLSDSLFYNNTYGLTQLSNVYIINCSIIKNKYGLNGVVGSISYSNISNNYIGVVGPSDDSKITRNSISDNNIGITLFKSSLVNLNNIYNNSEYNLKIIGSSNNDVTNNWWGTINTTLIEQYIYDINDNNNLGEARYKPFLKSPVDTTFRLPIADAGPDRNVTINQNVIFDGNDSYDPDGDRLIYKWDFGDGTSSSWSSSCISTHSYNQPGIYTVILKVKYDELLGVIDTCTIQVTQRPVANAGTDQNVNVNQIIYFDGNDSYDPDGDRLIYKWDFGDGDSTNFQNNSKTSHSYSLQGNYTILLLVSDDEFLDNDSCKVFVSEPDMNNHPEDANSDQNATTNNSSPNKNSDTHTIFSSIFVVIVIIIIIIILIIFYYIKKNK